MLDRTQGTAWRLDLHANAFAWKQFSKELVVQRHSGVMAIICTWRMEGMWGLFRAEEPSGCEMAGGISTSKPKINCFAHSFAFIPQCYSLRFNLICLNSVLRLMFYPVLCCISAVFPCLSKFRLEINRIFFPFQIVRSLGSFLVRTGKAKFQLVSRLSLVSL